MKRFILSAMLALAGCVTIPPPAHAVFNVADNYRPLRYIAAADQTSFNVTWPFEAETDLRVISSLDNGETWETREHTTEWTATGEGTSAGGSVVFVTGRVEAEIVVIYRNDGIDRTSQFTTITPTGVNTHLDRQTTQMQQVENIAENRALQVAVQHDFAGSGFSPVLPQLDAADVGFSIVVDEFHCQGTDTECESLLDCEADVLCVPTGFVYEANEVGEVIDSICPTDYGTADRLLRSTGTECESGVTGCSVSGTNADSISCPANITASGYLEGATGVRAANGSPLRIDEAVASAGSEYTALHSITNQPHTSLVYWPDDVPAVGEGLAVASVSGSGPYTIELDYSVPQTESPPYDVAMWQPGFPTDGQFVAGHVFTRAVVCADDFAGSQAKFSANFAADKVYNVYKNTSDIGDMACLTGASTCSFITGAIGTTSFAAGDQIRIYAPSTVDTTARDMMVTFKCTR
jgi:hypothetical protein